MVYCVLYYSIIEPQCTSETCVLTGQKCGDPWSALYVFRFSFCDAVGISLLRSVLRSSHLQTKPRKRDATY